MPNVRRESQTFLGVQIDRNLLLAVEKARGKTDRSKFVRDAIYRELQRRGEYVDPSWLDVPDRARKSIQYNPQPKALILNELGSPVSSEVAAAVEKGESDGDEIIAANHAHPVSGPSRKAAAPIVYKGAPKRGKHKRSGHQPDVQGEALK
jgi:hypothetical protein